MSKIELERLAFGYEDLSPLPHVGWWRRMKAILVYQEVVRLYRRHGFASTLKYLRELEQSMDEFEEATSLDVIRLARQHVLLFALLGKVLRQSNNCLAMAVSLTAGLITLGLDAKTVLGKTKQPEPRSYPFHAWVEVNETPILEDENIRNLYWVVDVLP